MGLYIAIFLVLFGLPLTLVFMVSHILTIEGLDVLLNPKPSPLNFSPSFSGTGVNKKLVSIIVHHFTTCSYYVGHSISVNFHRSSLNFSLYLIYYVHQ